MTDLEKPTFQIIHETRRVLSVSKPSGLLTQAPSGIDSLESRIRRYLAKQLKNNPELAAKPSKSKQEAGGKVYLGVPHRLDRPAAGVIVFAKDKRAARALAEQFQRREVRKIYWAIVSGTPSEAKGSWEDWMRKIPEEAKSETCCEGDEGAQKAVLHYQVANIDKVRNRTLLEIELETGRSHQIRLQAASRGLAILGDQLYGSPVLFGPQSDDQRDRWIALLARQLEVTDPDSQERLQLVAPIPSEWKAGAGAD